MVYDPAGQGETQQTVFNAPSYILIRLPYLSVFNFFSRWTNTGARYTLRCLSNLFKTTYT
jgi:hypothetical protein